MELYTHKGQNKILGNIRWLKEKGPIDQRAKYHGGTISSYEH